MPQAVSNVSSPASPSVPARASASPSAPSDADTFRHTLDSLQNKDAPPDAGGAETSPSSKASAKAGAEAASSPKAAAGDKVSSKKGARTAKSDPATRRKAASNESAEPESEPDPHLGDPDNGEQQIPSAGGKPQKKAVAKPDPDATAAPAGDVQLQGGSTLSHTVSGSTPPANAQVESSPGTVADGGADSSSLALDHPSNGDVATDNSADASDAASQAARAGSVRNPRMAKSRTAGHGEEPADPSAGTTDPATADLKIHGPVSSAPDLPQADAVTKPATSDVGAQTTKAVPKTLDDALLNSFAQFQPSTPLTTSITGQSNAEAAAPSPESQFAEANRSKIVSSIQGQLLPDGGSMQLTLDPAHLGPLQVRVEMKDGVMTASFETSNDQTAKLLSHSLGDLKTALEAQGVTVERLHVSQAPRQQASSGDSRQGGSEQGQNSASQQEQQRKEMMRRMWRKLMNGQDPLDLVA